VEVAAASPLKKIVTPLIAQLEGLVTNVKTMAPHLYPLWSILLTHGPYQGLLSAAKYLSTLDEGRFAGCQQAMNYCLNAGNAYSDSQSGQKTTQCLLRLGLPTTEQGTDKSIFVHGLAINIQAPQDVVRLLIQILTARIAHDKSNSKLKDGEKVVILGNDLTAQINAILSKDKESTTFRKVLIANHYSKFLCPKDSPRHETMSATWGRLFGRAMRFPIAPASVSLYLGAIDKSLQDGLWAARAGYIPEEWIPFLKEANTKAISSHGPFPDEAR